MSNLLLDTCTIIWGGQGERLETAAADLIQKTHDTGGCVYLSPFSAWELGLLVSKGRLRLALPVTEWFEEVRQRSGFQTADLSAAILAAASFLPGQPPSDPADRVLIATARAMDLILITRDRAVLGYAKDGHLRAIAC